MWRHAMFSICCCCSFMLESFTTIGFQWMEFSPSVKLPDSRLSVDRASSRKAFAFPKAFPNEALQNIVAPVSSHVVLACITYIRLRNTFSLNMHKHREMFAHSQDC